jgi:hypothetical protein
MMNIIKSKSRVGKSFVAFHSSLSYPKAVFSQPNDESAIHFLV